MIFVHCNSMVTVAAQCWVHSLFNFRSNGFLFLCCLPILMDAKLVAALLNFQTGIVDQVLRFMSHLVQFVLSKYNLSSVSNYYKLHLNYLNVQSRF